ncbi:MAG: helix-turn-helix domain-containing protein, partial [Janthinobacterium lividum]
QPFLSTIERGLSTPSMLTVYRIAAALGVQPGDLLPGPAAERVSVTRGADAALIPVSDAPGAAAGRALLMRPGAGLEVLEYRVAAGEHLGGWFEAPGEMAVLVVSGSLDVEVAGTGTWRLEAGDLLHQPGDLPHRWLTVDGGAVHVVLVAARTG